MKTALYITTDQPGRNLDYVVRLAERDCGLPIICPIGGMLALTQKDFGQLTEYTLWIYKHEGWQSITTAPKDGTSVLCWHPLWDMPKFAFLDSFPGRSGWKLTETMYAIDIIPTHWLDIAPLPTTTHGVQT